MIVTTDNEVKLIDFNVAVGDLKPDSIVCGGTGLKQWSAPETRTQLHYSAQRCDSWSLGMILAFLITGEEPSESVSCEERMTAALSSTSDECLQSCLQGLLRVKPEERLLPFQTL